VNSIGPVKTGLVHPGYRKGWEKHLRIFIF